MTVQTVTLTGTATSDAAGKRIDPAARDRSFKVWVRNR